MRASRDETRMGACCAAHIVGRGTLCERKPDRADTQHTDPVAPATSRRIARIRAFPPAAIARIRVSSPAPIARIGARGGRGIAPIRARPGHRPWNVVNSLRLGARHEVHPAAPRADPDGIRAGPSRRPRSGLADGGARRATRCRHPGVLRAALRLELRRRARPHRRGRRAIRPRARRRRLHRGPRHRLRGGSLRTGKPAWPRPARARARSCRAAGGRTAGPRPPDGRAIRDGRHRHRPHPAPARGEPQLLGPEAPGVRFRPVDGHGDGRSAAHGWGRTGRRPRRGLAEAAAAADHHAGCHGPRHHSKTGKVRLARRRLSDHVRGASPSGRAEEPGGRDVPRRRGRRVRHHRRPHLHQLHAEIGIPARKLSAERCREILAGASRRAATRLQLDREHSAFAFRSDRHDDLRQRRKRTIRLVPRHRNEGAIGKSR